MVVILVDAITMRDKVARYVIYSDLLLATTLIAVFCSISYQGHFVILCKYELKEDCFVYLDPSFSHGTNCDECEYDDIIANLSLFVGPLRVSSNLLDAARKHFGTDEDIIFCRR
jgi:hypothetical protein